MTQVNLRELVLSMLLSVTRDQAYSHVVLKDVLDNYQYLSKQERSYLTRVFQGTLEHMIWIDHVLNQFSSVKTGKMKPVIRTILRFSVYELQFMDAIPPRATCNEAVKLAQKKGFGNLKGFVNGVLRNISRELSHISLPGREEGEAEYLSLRYSMPMWIVKEWLGQYPVGQVEEMLASFLQEAPTSIRVNTSRISRDELIRRLAEEGIAAKPHGELPDGLFISGYDYLEALETFQEGLFYVQDVSSMRAAHCCQVQQGDTVLDVCAAPGGKSIHLAELLSGTGMVEARDLTGFKVGMIRENIKRSRLTNIKAVVKDARVFYPEDEASADVVLADLPCSGLGVIGKKPDIKYHMTQEKIGQLVALQREILHMVWRYVKPGGTFVYSTCTISRQENQENVSWFLREHPDSCLLEQHQYLPLEGEQDGFFLAKLIKENYE
ncbi:MAG: 16S rRNA (cytosine(967)-C(5))-methyltransferase RsmB [Lachnospiraceae bacterium]|nr:16S rRNA (cytosine(967)-C(5))-methyltransferase RsmB [Lachnospiraceae bacterium]